MPVPPMGPQGFIRDLKARECRVVRAPNRDDEPPFVTCKVQGPPGRRSIRIMAYFDATTDRFLYAYRDDIPRERANQIRTIIGVRRILGVHLP